jgi:hypothetical protein
MNIPERRDDFDRDYRMGVIQTTTTDTPEKFLFLFDHLRDGGGNMQGYILGKKGVDWEPHTLITDSVTMFDSTIPELGAINIPKGVIYLTRRGNRQWCKAYNENSVQGKMIAEHAYKAIKGNYIASLSGCVVNAVYNRDYPNIRMCARSITKGENVARAFCENFTLFVSEAYKEIILKYKNYGNVGYYDYELDTVHLVSTAENLLEELSLYTNVKIMEDVT